MKCPEQILLDMPLCFLIRVARPDFAELNNFSFPWKKKKTSSVVVTASFHRGLVTTVIFASHCRRVRAKNRLFKWARSSGGPDHWSGYCISWNKALNAVKAEMKQHLLSLQVRVLADPHCYSSKWCRVLPSSGLLQLGANTRSLAGNANRIRALLVCKKVQTLKFLQQYGYYYYYFLVFVDIRKTVS